MHCHRDSRVTPSAEGPERRQLTVMFTDLVGSTDLASALDPEDWHEVLNAYQHRVAAIVRAHGGVIAQFQGDGAVAYFGYPEAQESAGRDALVAGMEIVDDIVRLAAELPSALGIRHLQARAGIHTGEVLVAAVTAGGQERLPDVWGRVPNMAARLQAVGEPGQIVVSEETATLVTGFFELEPLGSLSLKGIGHAVPAFRVVQRSNARTRLDAGPLTMFISRAGASDWLHEQWAHLDSGSGRLVVVSGEPGIGKSRLLFEFGAEIEARRHPVVTLVCSRRGSLSPLQPFGEVMGHVPTNPHEAAAWVDVQADHAPLLLVVEDAHWADPSTLEAVHVIAGGSTPVLVVVSARPEIVDDPHVVPEAELQLDRLSSEESRRMLEQLPGASRLTADVREALVQRADGIPLFLEELARGLADGASVSAHAMPTTLSEVITARLDRVGEAKRVAQAAAVVGRSFDRRVLEAATGLEGVTLDAELRRLQEHAIIESSPRSDEMQFRHALIQEISYRSVLRADRVRVHGVVGETLIASGRAAAQPEIAAYHLGAAGRATEAVPLWKQASHAARQNARFLEAAGHEREVLALVDQLPEDDRDDTELKSRGRLVMCLTAVDQSAPEALEESRRVEELARRLGNREILLRNYMVLVPWWQASAEYKTINWILREARTEAEVLGDEWTLGLIDTYEGTTRIWQGMLHDGLAQLRASYETSLPLDASLRDLPPMRSVELMALAAPRVATALACWLTGNTTEAWRIADDVLRCTTERQVPQAQAVAAVTSAIMAQLDGEREVVVKLAGEALHVADEVSTRQWRQWARSLQWWAREGMEEPELPGPLLRPYFEMLLADDLLAGAERARGLLDDALDTARTTGEQFCEAEILRLRAGVLRRGRRVEQAARDYRDAVRVARRQGARMLELRALTDWLGLPGAPDNVRADLEASVAETAEGGPSRSLTEARRALEST
jgi:class 3 adenylate cyclase